MFLFFFTMATLMLFTHEAFNRVTNVIVIVFYMNLQSVFLYDASYDLFWSNYQPTQLSSWKLIIKVIAINIWHFCVYFVISKLLI